MDQAKNSKLSKEVSTKITDEEHYLLGIIAKYCQSRGYIAKANTSEITRFLLRASMEWASSRMKAMNQIKSQSIVSESRNPVTALGKSSASTLDKTGDTGQGESHDSSISRGNISSTDSVRQSSDLHGNSIGILAPDAPTGYCKMPQAKVKVGSINTRNETGNAFGRINNVRSRPADSRVSQVDKNLTGVSGPSLELIGEYVECLRQIPGLNRYNRYLAPKLALAL
jgi:hypothetical protein